MGKIIFITGTDTGVGKTFLTALLLRHLRQKKIHALAMKPFCTGSREDVYLLQKLQPGELSDSTMNPFYFRRPVAPFVAAQMQGKKIYLNEVLKKIFKLKDRCDVLLVEGAGGLMVPLGSGFLTRDLIAKLDCQILIVARNSLGTLNHTLLSAEALLMSGCKQFAVVLMNLSSGDTSAGSNKKTLETLLHSTKVLLIPFLPNGLKQAGAATPCGKKIKKILAAMIETD
ncbi:MAG: dethiobiotin synthase [Verrucomicrobiota bacterium]